MFCVSSSYFKVADLFEHFDLVCFLVNVAEIRPPYSSSHAPDMKIEIIKLGRDISLFPFDATSRVGIMPPHLILKYISGGDKLKFVCYPKDHVKAKLHVHERIRGPGIVIQICVVHIKAVGLA